MVSARGVRIFVRWNGLESEKPGNSLIDACDHLSPRASLSRESAGILVRGLVGVDSKNKAHFF